MFLVDIPTANMLLSEFNCNTRVPGCQPVCVNRTHNVPQVTSQLFQDAATMAAGCPVSSASAGKPKSGPAKLKQSGPVPAGYIPRNTFGFLPNREKFDDGDYEEGFEDSEYGLEEGFQSSNEILLE